MVTLLIEPKLVTVVEITAVYDRLRLDTHSVFDPRQHQPSPWERQLAVHA